MKVFIKWLGVLLLCMISTAIIAAISDAIKYDLKWFAGWVAAIIYFNLCFDLKGKL